MEDPELIAICEALIDADPTMSGYHESHIAVKMPYALAVQKRLRSLTMWQPIETAPKDGTEVLLLVWAFNEVGGERLVAVGRWVEYMGEWVESGDDDAQIYPPIAWLPLPTPPEADT